MSFKIVSQSKLWLVLLIALCPLRMQAEEPAPPAIRLWPGGAPLAQGTADEDQPKLTIYIPKAAPGKAAMTKTAVVVCPGGAYAMLAMDHEGRQVAQWLNNLGVAAFVLQYRLGTRYHHPAQLMDAARALRYVRAHANEFHVASDRIGIWGFSAGGHLASTAGTHFDGGDVNAADPVDRVSSRPDFMILAYPVIDPLGPAAVFSFQQLLGEHPDPKLVASLSNDQQVTPQTPPTFLVHADDDAGVLPENSVNFYLALRKEHVPAEMHIYQFGGHGFGLAPLDPVLSSWTARLADWMRGRNLLQP